MVVLEFGRAMRRAIGSRKGTRRIKKSAACDTTDFFSVYNQANIIRHIIK